jgi:hypothetical protein
MTEDKELTELTGKVARDATWEVYETRVKDILKDERASFERGDARTRVVMKTPGHEEYNIIGAAIVGGLMNERAAVLYRLGELGQELAGHQTPHYLPAGTEELAAAPPEARRAMLLMVRSVMDFVRARGPHYKPKEWGAATEHKGDNRWPWEHELDEERAVGVQRRRDEVMRARLTMTPDASRPDGYRAAWSEAGETELALAGGPVEEE